MPTPKPTSPTTDRLVKTIDLAAPVPRVWQALTDHRQFGQWFRVSLDSPFAPGKPSRGQILHPGYEHVHMEVIVQQITPQSLFSYTWHPYAIHPKVDYSKEPPTLVEFTLAPSPRGTLLTVTESGFDRVPVGRRDEAFRMNSNGWAAQLANIEKHVQQNP